MFQDKIVEKMKALTDKKSSDTDNGFLSNKLKLMLSQRKHNDLGDGPTSEKLRTKKLWDSIIPIHWFYLVEGQ